MKKINILMLSLIMVMMGSCALHSNSGSNPTYFTTAYYKISNNEKTVEFTNPENVVLTKDYLIAQYFEGTVMLMLTDKYKKNIPLKIQEKCLIGENYYNQVYFNDYSDDNIDTVFANRYYQDPCLTITKLTKKYIQGEFVFYGSDSTIVKSEFAGKLQKPKK